MLRRTFQGDTGDVAKVKAAKSTVALRAQPGDTSLPDTLSFCFLNDEPAGTHLLFITLFFQPSFFQ